MFRVKEKLAMDGNPTYNPEILHLKVGCPLKMHLYI